MKVLVVGSGGREHALAWKIKQSPLVDELIVAPGNAGIAQVSRTVDISVEDLSGLRDFARTEKVDLTVVGPEAPLAAGIADMFEEANLRIFGPRSVAAELEGSKAFCKALLRRHAIPSAGFRTVSEVKAAADYLRSSTFPVVVKADGLAAGKGVVVCAGFEEALRTTVDMLEQKKFGKAGEKVVIEDFLSGPEVSVLAFVDGRNMVVLEPAQDHKRALDDDKGPNTGGMGAYSPVPIFSETDMARTVSEILVPVVHALHKEGRTYKGILYAGLMLTQAGPKVLEFNVRFGDPETQPILMRLKSDIVPLFLATIDGTLDRCDIEWDEHAAVCVVVASGGYPDKYAKGAEIRGLDEATLVPDVQVFHAGTAMSAGKIVTSGGRVIGVTALGSSITAARETAYRAIERISFEKMRYRRDIAARAVK
jgi:phosphoribosylamine--glycine ligase